MSKRILITGGTKGIGKGIAAVLLKEDHKVAITGRSEESLKESVEELSTISKDILGICSDVRQYENEQDAVKKINEVWGGLDVLVANAGLGHFHSIEDLTLEQWNQTIDVNLTGVFHSVKAAIPSLKESKGYIMTVASLAGTNFFAKGSAYNASKFGLVGFTQAIMLDLRDYGIKVTTIMPGSVATHFNNNVPSDKDAWKIQPEDIGQMVNDLLKINPRTLPSKIEVRPSQPASK